LQHNNDICTSDAVLSHESENAEERILSLEKKLQQQDDEIVCLKSALADALRRLTTLESGLLSVFLSVCLSASWSVCVCLSTCLLACPSSCHGL